MLVANVNISQAKVHNFKEKNFIFSSYILSCGFRIMLLELKGQENSSIKAEERSTDGRFYSYS